MHQISFVLVGLIVIHALYVDLLYFVIGHHASILLVKFDGCSTFAWLMAPDFKYIQGFKGNCVCKGYAHSSSPGMQTRPGLKLQFVIGHHASILLVKFDGCSTFAWLITYILGYKGNSVCKGYAHSLSPGMQIRPGLKLQFVIGHHDSILLVKFGCSSRSQTYLYPLKVGLRTRLPRVHVRLSASTWH